MAKVGFIGDTHGNVSALKFMLWAMSQNQIDEVLQVGDFGVYTDQSGTKFANTATKLCEDYGIELKVVPGNHENHRVINELLGDDRTTPSQYRAHVSLLPRGYRWEFGGMSFVALGGAPSVDRTYRMAEDRLFDDRGKVRANRYWYPEEQITQADVDYTVAGGYADVMVAHDAPHGIQEIERRISGNPHGFHIADILYAEDGRKLMTEAFQGVAPKYFFHGHYHFPVNEMIRRPGGLDTTHVIGLDCEFHNYSMAILDTETGVAKNIDHKKLLWQARSGTP